MRKYKTLKDAYADEFHDPVAGEYDGEEIILEGKTLKRFTKWAKSKSQWRAEGFKLKDGAVPLCQQYARKIGSWFVYKDDQVIAVKKMVSRPAREIDVILALWTLNRRAKRCRDLASQYYINAMYGFIPKIKIEKETIYNLKGQTLHYLIAENRLWIKGYHKFENQWAEVLTSKSGFVFHRPCPIQTIDAPDLESIEAKPKGSKEPRIKDAFLTINKYLSDKATVIVFEWDRSSYPDNKVCHACGQTGHIARNCPEKESECYEKCETVGGILREEE